tara:strand:+ start:8066 stop:8659 length:594 start_codon:yes stop_codon:yes gene_type:complete
MQLVYDIGDKRYINLTNKCNLRCNFCPKFNGRWRVHEHELRLKNKPGADAYVEALGDLSEISEVVFCGFGEPTRELDTLLYLAQYVKTQGIPVRVNTDGLGNWFHQKNILPQLQPYVDALSISLNAQNAETYEQHCRPPDGDCYFELISFIADAPQYIDDVTITAINGLEDADMEKCRNIAERFNVKFRQRELDVVG